MTPGQILDYAWNAIEQSDGNKALKLIAEYDAMRDHGYEEPTINGTHGDEVAHTIYITAKSRCMRKPAI